MGRITERWTNDKDEVVNQIEYHGKTILVLTDDHWNIEEVTKYDDQLVIIIDRKGD